MPTVAWPSAIEAEYVSYPPLEYEATALAQVPASAYEALEAASILSTVLETISLPLTRDALTSCFAIRHWAEQCIESPALAGVHELHHLRAESVRLINDYFLSPAPGMLQQDTLAMYARSYSAAHWRQYTSFQTLQHDARRNAIAHALEPPATCTDEAVALLRDTPLLEELLFDALRLVLMCAHDTGLVIRQLYLRIHLELDDTPSDELVLEVHSSSPEDIAAAWFASLDHRLTDYRRHVGEEDWLLFTERINIHLY